MNTHPIPLTKTELEAGLEQIRLSPQDNGVIHLIVRRPAENQRELVEQGELDLTVGLVGDNWKLRGSSSRPDGSAEPEAQVTLMNSRAIALFAQENERWPLAGDQIYLDLDLSVDNLPPGARLALGTAVIEVTAKPHTGCSKFAERFGAEAVRFVNSPEGKKLHLRGINARVVRAGTIRVGEMARKVE